MKKILLLFLILAFNASYGFDYSSYCSNKTPEKTAVGNLNSVLGVNSLSRNIIEKEIEHLLKKETNSKFKVKINSFYGTNIFNGEFKSAKVTAKNYEYKGLFASNLEVDSICSYNKIDYKNKTLTFETPVVLKYSTEITQQDLDKIISSSGYRKMLDKMNEDKIISSFFRIQDAKVVLRNNRLVFKYEVLPSFSIFNLSKKPIDIIFGANLCVEDGQVQLCDLDFNSIKTSYQTFLPLINALNPLSYKLKVDKNNNGELKFESVKIQEGKIKLEGFIIIPKSAAN